MVFFEDQTVGDFKDDNDPQSSPNDLVDLDLDPSLIVHGDGGGMQEDDGDDASDEASMMKWGSKPLILHKMHH